MIASFFKKYQFAFSTLAIFLLLAISSLIVKNNNYFSTENVLGFKELLPTPAPYPINKNNYFLPELTANSMIAIDLDSGVTLYEKNADVEVSPASTTKLMSALVSLENYPLDLILTVSGTKIDGNTIKLVPGEQMTVQNLLYGLLVGSGNDAAEVLAENFSNGTVGFIWAMNQKAIELGLKDTHFTNPIGLDEETHFSTARDLAKLAQAALKSPLIAKIVSTPEAQVTDVSGKIIHTFKNTNELVGQMSEVKGVKTGWTENAGECLITLVEKNQRRVLIVILGSTDRFGETKTLINWIFDNFEWQTLTP